MKRMLTPGRGIRIRIRIRRMALMLPSEAESTAAINRRHENVTESLAPMDRARAGAIRSHVTRRPEANTPQRPAGSVFPGGAHPAALQSGCLRAGADRG